MLRTRDKQRGMTLAMTAIAITSLLALAALAIDMGILYTARTSAQHAADAGALAGAYTFALPPTPDPTASARIAAENVANMNPILGKMPTIGDGDVDVDLANRRVTVRVPRTGANGIPTFFAKIFGRNSTDVQATATAECGVTSVGVNCLKPIYIPNTILSDKDALPACNSVPRETIFNPDGTITQWAQQKLGTWKDIRPLDPGTAKKELAAGQFFSLDFGAGANTYSCTLGSCLSDCNVNVDVVRCGQSYPLKTGNMVGPTKQGVNDLTGPTPDQWVNIGQYQYPDGKIYDSSNQLVVAPVWDSCTQTIVPGFRGQTVKIIGFMQLFIDGMDKGNDVKAHFVRPVQCPPPGGDDGNQFGSNSSPTAIPIRLVKTP